MKSAELDIIDNLKKKYSKDVLLEVLHCRDDIRCDKMAEIECGYDEGEVEQRIGDYLDEIYIGYQKCSEQNFGISEAEFDNIYAILEDIDGQVVL